MQHSVDARRPEGRDRVDHRQPTAGPHHDEEPGMSRQWFASGVVEAPVDAVFTALLAVGPAADLGDQAEAVTVEVDHDRHTLAVQGRWWYRGVHAVREHPRGSLIEYRVHNVAT